MKKELNFQQTIKKVGIITIVCNGVLSIIKCIVGIISGATAMISDAVHSVADIFPTIIVMIGAKISARKPDNKHMYGYERFESIATLFLSFILCALAFSMGYGGISEIIAFNPTEYDSNATIYWALGSVILVVVVKAAMYVYASRAANRIKSNSLKADAWHHLSDSFSSIASIFGIVGLMIGNGWQILDPIATIIICIIILKVAVDIAKNAIGQLVDKSIPSQYAAEIKAKILASGEVLEIAAFRSRQFGNKICLDIELYVNSSLTLVESNSMIDRVRSILVTTYRDIKSCTICARPKEVSIDIIK